jgi:hypothetical protein
MRLDIDRSLHLFRFRLSECRIVIRDDTPLYHALETLKAARWIIHTFPKNTPEELALLRNVQKAAMPSRLIVLDVVESN